MKLSSIILVLLVIISFSSCISTKQLTYLAADEEISDSLISIQQMQRPYRVQINDLLSIRVKALDQELTSIFNPISDAENSTATTEEKAYFDGFPVDRHGNIRIPTLGEIKVIGLTLEEIRLKLREKLLSEYFKTEANIFITVKLAGLRYTTLGEIGSGSQVIYKEQVSIMEAIANAGNITLYGDRRNVKILRQYPEGQRLHKIDLTKITAVNSPFYYIQPNDLIIVNPLPQKSLGIGETSFGTFATLFSLITGITILLFRL
ncbi:polysaccharide biosynthesis/export family protein [Psychroflexus sp. CAK57W]|uniref:polysaccharide biosynthesis/export family protein n=1 Tax=Psychroflexus curvus TaxID=2873595 RepID=UPI001CCF9A63|nr:polysaccharide biosynthesis/export family protein [Psychroflexus curvus]MBZ9786455.1 polysaccharide biosynthesis/export family protein [Psychroflexus curvus]